MIITSVQAKNVLRYAELKLTNLPRSGLIGVSGSNESGKTTIAEIICLALFGRTFSLSQDEVQKNIKWGEFGGSVTVGFVAKDGQAYQIIRAFDADGNHTAQLQREGEAEPFIRGVDAVNENVTQLCGFTYQRFIDSFYLAQRNIAAPHILQQTAKALAGVETFEQLAADCEHDIQQAQEALAPINTNISETRRQRTELNIQADVLPNLKTERNAQAKIIADQKDKNAQRQAMVDGLRTSTTQLVTQCQKTTQADLDTSFKDWLQHADQVEKAAEAVHQASERAEEGSGGRLTGALSSWSDDLKARLQAFTGVRDAAAAYRQRLAWSIGQGDRPASVDARSLSFPDQAALITSQVEGVGSKRAAVVVGFVAMLALMSLCWGALWFINHAPNDAIGQWLMNDFQLDVSHNSTLFFAAVACSVFCLVLLVMTFVLSSQAMDARQEVARLQREQSEIEAQVEILDDLPKQSLATEVATLQTYEDDQLRATVVPFAAGPGASLLDADAVTALTAPLTAAAETCEEDADAIAKRLAKDIQAGEQSIATIQAEVDQLDQAVSAEEARLNKAAQLDLQIVSLESDLEQKMHDIEVRRIAQNLLAGSHRRLLSRFNLEMRHVVSKIMPQLTDGRYETMQIDNDLNLEVWSNEKGNFVGLNEVSGGTYNQVMLAVRLALSQALITSSLCGAEFIIFDEPFAFFDAQRTKKTLETLPQVSPEIAQTWIIAQEFADDSQFALHLSCSRDSDVLIAAGS